MARLRTKAVVNNKGGVGKTHTVFHLAGAYAEKGKRVLVIDLDPQGNLTGLFLPTPKGPTLYQVLVDDRPLADAVHPTEFDGITVVPAHRHLQRIDALLADEPDAQIRLADALEEYAEHPDAPDLVLLDCPPNLGLATRSALAAADEVLIPVEADKFSVDGLDSLLQVIQSMRRFNPRLEIAGILVSLFNSRRAIETMYEENLRGKSLPLLDVKIKDSSKYREAITARKPITHYKPTGEHAEAFRTLITELEERVHAS